MQMFKKTIVLIGIAAVVLLLSMYHLSDAPKAHNTALSNLDRDIINKMADNILREVLAKLPTVRQQSDEQEKLPQKQDMQQDFSALAAASSSATTIPPSTAPVSSGANNPVSMTLKLPDIYNKDFQEKDQMPIKEYIDYLLSTINHRQKDELLPKCTQPQNNFVYLKNHKCASDTMSAVFRRFGYVRNQAMVQPVGGRWNIGWPYWLQPHMYRPGQTGHFNILTEHTVYNETYMRKIMAPDSVYISSIREPFAHLKSAFYFFGMPQVRNHIEVTAGQDLILSFLQDKDGWDKAYMNPDVQISRPCIPKNFSVVRNMMSFDLGLPTGFHLGYPSQENNMTFIIQWLEHLDAKYDMVMLVEYFHESLVMLKRIMCWTAKDVIYLKLNARRSNKAVVHYPQELIDDFLRWSLPDTLLYAHFNRTFWERVEVMGRDDFMAEVADLISILDLTIPYCESLQTDPSKPPLEFLATIWNPSFTITSVDCNLIMSKLGVRQELRDRYDQDRNNLKQPEGVIPGC